MKPSFEGVTDRRTLTRAAAHRPGGSFLESAESPARAEGIDPGGIHGHTANMSPEKRKVPRAEVSKKLQVTYVDEQGCQRFEIVSAQDLSASGCRILLKFRCRARSIVALSLTPANSGSATVRYQNATLRGYVTGLEFLGGLVLPPAIPLH